MSSAANMSCKISINEEEEKKKDGSSVKGSERFLMTRRENTEKQRPKFREQYKSMNIDKND